MIPESCLETIWSRVTSQFVSSIPLSEASIRPSVTGSRLSVTGIRPSGMSGFWFSDSRISFSEASIWRSETIIQLSDASIRPSEAGIRISEASIRFSKANNLVKFTDKRFHRLRK